MRFTDYIWDFDGTLVDSYPRMTRAYRQALSELGYEIDEAELLLKIKQKARQAAAECAAQLGLDTAEVLGKMISAERVAEGGLDPYPGTAEALQRIVALGGRNFLYTHRDKGAIEALREHDLLSLFTGWITEDDHFPNKPKPDAVLHLIKKHDIEPSRAVMVGDRALDLEAGANAGIAGCLFDPDGFYADYPCELRAQTMEEFMRLIGLTEEGMT